MRTVLHWIVMVTAFLALCLVLVGGGSADREPPEAFTTERRLHFAHRAGDRVFPENCLAGVLRADSLGYDGVEIDVRRSADGVLVAFHDDSCMRLLGRPEPMEHLTLQQLREQPLRLHDNPTAEMVPTISELLQAAPSGLLFYFDVKPGDLVVGDSLAALIARHGALHRCAVASSSIRFLAFTSYRYPGMTTVLEGFDRGEEWTWWCLPRNFRPHLMSSFAAEVDEDHARWLHAHGLQRRRLVYGTTAEDLLRLERLGISRFIVDEPVR
jgi:glycerophosphoryl diester phosphodiesterase